jgi:hypothetical protein
VTVGLTLTAEFAPSTAPTPPLTVRLFAPVTFQDNVALCPIAMEVGVEEKVLMSGAAPDSPVVD